MRMNYEMQLGKFREHLSAIKQEDRKEFDKIMRAVVPIWVNTATKYSPPDIKSSKIDAIRYQDGVVTLTDDKNRTYGRRKIFDLLASVKSGNCKSSEIGRAVRQCYLYLVYPRKGKKKFCKTLEEAQRYAHISNRGLYRASWGLSAATVSGKIPASTRTLLQQRPELSKHSGMNTLVYDPVQISVTITNSAIPDGIGSIAARNADYATTDILLKRVQKYFLKDVPF